MRKFINKCTSIWILIGLIVSFISINVILNLLSDKAFIDMTDAKRYSLSPISIKQAQQLSEPIYITVYYSSDIPAENPIVGKYAEFVLQYLKQYQKANPDKIFITVKNPIPYSEEEKEAKKAQLDAFRSSGGENNLYFGAVFKNSNDKILTIPHFSWERDFWLEKDITNILAQFNNPQKKVIGIISPVHKMIKKDFIKGINSYAVVQELSERYNIWDLAPNIKEIPNNVDAVIFVLPRKMPQMLVYALDQYLMTGGRLIILLDMWSEQTDYKTTYDTMADINKFLERWGVRISDTLVGSRRYGQRIFLRFGKDDIRQTPYPLWLNLTSETINKTESITKNLSKIHLRSPIEITEVPHSDEISITPLIEIDDGAIFHKEEIEMGKNHIVSKYEADQKSHILSALIRGKNSSLFLQAPKFASENERPFLFYNVAPAQILVVGDSDFMTDDVWLEDGELNDNGQFLLNAVDNMVGETEMATLHKSQNRIYQESLGSEIYNKIKAKHVESISRLQNELQSLKIEQDMISKTIESGLQSMDSFTAKRLTEIQDNVKAIQTRLQYYNYRIKKAFETQTQYIIFINMIVIPVLEILALIFGYMWYSRRCRQKIKEKFNVR